jgi:hypothetical protein
MSSKQESDAAAKRPRTKKRTASTHSSPPPGAIPAEASEWMSNVWGLDRDVCADLSAWQQRLTGTFLRYVVDNFCERNDKLASLQNLTCSTPSSFADLLSLSPFFSTFLSGLFLLVWCLIQPNSSRTFTTPSAASILSAKRGRPLRRDDRPRRLWWKKSGAASTWTKAAPWWTLRRCKRCGCKRTTTTTRLGRRRMQAEGLLALLLSGFPRRLCRHHQQQRQQHPPPPTLFTPIRAPHTSQQLPHRRRRIPHPVFYGLTRRPSRGHSPSPHLRQSLHQAWEVPPLRTR